MQNTPEDVELIRLITKLLAEVVAPIVAGILLGGFVFLGPIGRAIGEVIRRRLGGGARRDLEQAEDSAEISARLDDISRQIGEVVERQEFAERLLSRARQERGLPGAGGAEE